MHPHTHLCISSWRNSLASTASSFLLGRAHALSLMVAKPPCLGREALSPEHTWAAETSPQATSQALEVPQFLGLASATDTDVENGCKSSNMLPKVGEQQVWDLPFMGYGHSSISSAAHQAGSPKKPKKLGGRHAPCWEACPQITVRSCLYI